MAVIADVRSLYKNNQKKATRATTARLALADTGDVAVGASVVIATLPANCVIVDAFFTVVEAPTGGTQTIKLEIGATQLMKAIATGTTVGAVKQDTVTKLNTGTGADVQATVGVGTLQDGVFDITLLYIESDRTVGEFTEG